MASESEINTATSAYIIKNKTFITYTHLSVWQKLKHITFVFKSITSAVVLIVRILVELTLDY